MALFGDLGDDVPHYEEDDLVGPRTADGLHCELTFEYAGARRQVLVTALYGRIDASEYFRGQDVETGLSLVFKTSRVEALWLPDGRVSSGIAWHLGDLVRVRHGLPTVEGPYSITLPELAAVIRFRQADGEMDPDTGDLRISEREVEYVGVATGLALEYRTYATRYVLTFCGRPTDGSKRKSTFRVATEGGRVLTRYIDADTATGIEDWPGWLRSRAK